MGTDQPDKGTCNPSASQYPPSSPSPLRTSFVQKLARNKSAGGGSSNGSGRGLAQSYAGPSASSTTNSPAGPANMNSSVSASGGGGSTSGPRRIFSISRRDRGKEKEKEKQRDGTDGGAHSRPPLTARGSASKPSPNPSASANKDDDSPFIRPPSPSSSPPLSASRGPRLTFGLEASMRVGTQALIQALQALQGLPLSDADAEHDADPTSASASSADERPRPPPLSPAPPADAESDSNEDVAGLASSIHTIHRPLARKRRTRDAVPIPGYHNKGKGKGKELETGMGMGGLRRRPAMSDVEQSPSEGEGESGAEGEVEDESERDERGEDGGDFEVEEPESFAADVRGGARGPPSPSSAQTTPKVAMSAVAERIGREMQKEGGGGGGGARDRVESLRERSTASRSGSMATVRLKRRARLADKLRDVFELPGINEVVAELPCWLFSRSVLLQGFMYLTNAYLCFFAHLPAKEDQVLKSGSLYKKAQRTKRWIKHWFVLKNDVLSWYQSAADPYFPHGVADLRYALSCEPHGEKELRIRTNAKTIHLSADSARQRDDWAKAVRRAMFKSQHEGAHVKVAVPYGLIVDVDKSRAMDWTETVEVKVLEGGVAMDSYFFAYFKDIDGALEQMRDVVRTYRPAVEGGSGSGTAQIMDTTVPRAPASSPQDAPPRPSLDRAGELSPSASTSSSRMSAAFRLSSLWKPISDSLPLVRSPVSAGASLEPQAGERPDEFMHIKKGSSFVPRTAAPRSMTTDPGVHARAHAHAVPGMMGERSVSEGAAGLARSEHTYPPGTLAVEAEPAPSPTWSVGVPSWLRVPGRRAPTSPASAAVVAGSVAGVKEVYATSGGRHRSTGSAGSGAELGYSVLDPGAGVDPEMRDKFRTYFAFDEKETLLGYFPGYIYRVLPVYGRLYVSTNYFCFKAGALASKTKMILPIRDILSTEPSKAFHFGRYGLVMNLKGYEELFFEFGVEDRRSAFVRLLERQMEDVRSRAQLAGAAGQQDTRDALIFEEYDSRQSSSISSGSDMRGSTDAAVTESLPAHMFTSASSTFLTFKPKESLHFTFLTIGSRGDVQPYIALAKGLMADGHRVRIATHGEFKEWIESHGIEFGYVGGDPAELMRICVENGTFTVSFLKEGLLKFRGWLDDLLKTSWEACQGTDVLIESPSAMAGFHIAEALRIPYFRAFTMTWTRTRAYPHAFAVPERKMGGGYNYMTFVMFDQVFWRAISGQINRWRRKTLGLPSTSLDKMEPHKVPFLYNFSPTIVPPPLDWPEWIRVTGYWFLDSAEVSAQKWTPPAELVQFIDSAHQAGKKVVYIGFGSIVVSDPKGMTRSVIEAIVRSGVYAILSKGWSDRLNAKTGEASEPEEPLPKQIYQINSIPHDWLFQRIDAACHHGGAGTTGASLRAGIPTIIRPFFGDQFFWADRVEALGVGAGVRHLTSESLAQALIAATTDEKQIQRAKVVGERIRAENGVGTAIEAIYRDLEYARSLIKRRADEDVGSDAENATIRESLEALPDPQSPESVASSYGSGPRASSDWSVISGDDGTPSSLTSRRSSYGGDGRLDRPQLPKRNSLAAAVLSVLPSPAAIRPRTPRSTSSPSPSR